MNLILVSDKTYSEHSATETDPLVVETITALPKRNPRKKLCKNNENTKLHWQKHLEIFT